MTQQNFWESVTKKAAELGGSIGNVASQATQAAAETAVKAGETVAVAASEATAAVAEMAAGSKNSNINEPLDMAAVAESDRLAFYGALFAIAAADGSLQKDEMELIFGIMDLEGMSETAKRKIQSYIIEPPPLQQCLKVLSKADERLRFGLMLNLIDTAWADDELDPREQKAIRLAQQELRVADSQVEAIEKFIKEVKKIRDRGLDDNQAADAVKTAAAGLSAVGIPIAAVYFSGSVIGLSAAGITSGLAALGLGFGMVPGIGIAILLGTGIFWGVSTLLDTGGKRAKEEEMKLRERKAILVIENLQGALNGLVERIETLQKAAADAEANREAIRILTEKMRYIQQLLAKRKQAGL